MVICEICKKEFKYITITHLKYKHNLDFNKYLEMFPNTILVNDNIRIKISIANKNKIISEETRRKIGIANSNPSEETRRKISLARLGKKLSQDWKDNISKSLEGNNYSKGHTPWNKGKQCPTIAGKNSPHWKGGISFLPYCSRFNNKLKKQIRERDNNICQECGKTEEKNGRKLDVHHIHYDKENCNPDLITLCISCNIKVNFNRDYWEEHFMNLIKF